MVLDRDLEHPLVTRIRRDGELSEMSEPESSEMSEEEFIQIGMKRKAPNEADTSSEAKENQLSRLYIGTKGKVNMGENTELIVVKQLPIIEEHLRKLSEEIKKSVSEAMSLVCTEETVKSVKTIRTSLTKQFASLEEQRKAIKKAIMAPYDEFETTYKECVSEPFKSADADLKGKIDEVENSLKAEKAAEVEAYFSEYAQSKNIDFVTFEHARIQITLSASLKSLKEQSKAFLDKIADDLALIDTQDNKEEILVEYKNTLNVANAITTVSKRHADIEAERKRQEALTALKATEEPRVADVEALSAPVVVIAPPEEKRYTATFTVSATLGELEALKEFLDNGGYKYESN